MLEIIISLDPYSNSIKWSFHIDVVFAIAKLKVNSVNSSSVLAVSRAGDLYSHLRSFSNRFNGTTVQSCSTIKFQLPY